MDLKLPKAKFATVVLLLMVLLPQFVVAKPSSEIVPVLKGEVHHLPINLTLVKKHNKSEGGGGSGNNCLASFEKCDIHLDLCCGTCTPTDLGEVCIEWDDIPNPDNPG